MVQHGGAANGLSAGPPAHLILGHHVGPMQDQHFDDLVAAEPRGIMQRRVAFLREMQPCWGSWSSSGDRDALPVASMAPQLPAHPPTHEDKGDRAHPSSGCGCQHPRAGMHVHPDMSRCGFWETPEGSAKVGASVLPPPSTGCMAAALTLSGELMSTPLWMRCSTMSGCPVRVATWRGVLSSLREGGDGHQSGSAPTPDNPTQGQRWCPGTCQCPWHSPVPPGSALHTLSFRLRSAPRSCSSLTASRCPPRQAQCAAVQSSWVHRAMSQQGTPPLHVHPPPQPVPVPRLSRQNPAHSHLGSGDSAALLQGPQPCCCSGCAVPGGSDQHGARGRIQPHPVPEVDGGPTVQQLLQDVHVSLQRGAVQGCAVELGGRGTALADRSITPRPSPAIPPAPSRGSQPSSIGTAGHGGQAQVRGGQRPWGTLPHHTCQGGHHLPETSR